VQIERQEAKCPSNGVRNRGGKIDNDIRGGYWFLYTILGVRGYTSDSEALGKSQMRAMCLGRGPVHAESVRLVPSAVGDVPRRP